MARKHDDCGLFGRAKRITQNPVGLGIFKPRIFPQIPLSITTAPHGPYDDHFEGDDLLLYRYRGEDPNHRDNVGLREAWRDQIPLIYFHGIASGKYVPVWPVFIVGDDPERLTFQVAADDAKILHHPLSQATLHEPEEEARRIYITATVQQRLHQRTFRERVMQAYGKQCALCRLRHEELLDAAHIIPDGKPGGEPIVQNGLSLCKLHHAAFDRHFLGIRPDYVVELRRDLLKEHDGPMLQHGLQGMHQQRIHLPRSRDLKPDPNRLAQRWGEFKAAS